MNSWRIGHNAERVVCCQIVHVSGQYREHSMRTGDGGKLILAISVRYTRNGSLCPMNFPRDSFQQRGKSHLLLNPQMKASSGVARIHLGSSRRGPFCGSVRDSDVFSLRGLGSLIGSPHGPVPNMGLTSRMSKLPAMSTSGAALKM